MSLEAWLGAIISVVIIKAGVDILREAIAKILGERVDGDLSRNVKEAVCSIEGVRSAHDLILNDYGPDRLWGSIHVAVDASMTAEQIDGMTRAIQMLVYERFGIIITAVGIYSSSPDTADRGVMRDIARIAGAQDEVIEVHGIYVSEAAKMATFDIVVSFDAKDQNAVRDRILRELELLYPDYRFFVAIDPDISD